MLVGLSPILSVLPQSEVFQDESLQNEVAEVLLNDGAQVRPMKWEGVGNKHTLSMRRWTDIIFRRSDKPFKAVFKGF